MLHMPMAQHCHTQLAQAAAVVVVAPKLRPVKPVELQLLQLADRVPDMVLLVATVEMALALKVVAVAVAPGLPAQTLAQPLVAMVAMEQLLYQRGFRQSIPPWLLPGKQLRPVEKLPLVVVVEVRPQKAMVAQVVVAQVVLQVQQMALLAQPTQAAVVVVLLIVRQVRVAQVEPA